jgi:hypothetical protein
MIPIELDDLARLGHPRAEQRAAARDHVGLAREIARAVDDDRGLGRAGRPDDLDAAADDHEEGHNRFAFLDENLSGLDLPHLAVRPDPLDLRRRQLRKDMVEAGGDRLQGGRSTLGHPPILADAGLLRTHSRSG